MMSYIDIIFIEILYKSKDKHEELSKIPLAQQLVDLLLLFCNALIKCKVPKVLKSKGFEKICLFEPSYRHKSDYAECHIYEGIVVMDNEVVNSGIFHVTMTNGSSRHIKINCGQIMGMIKSCNEDNICTMHKIATFQQTSEDTKPQLVEKEMYCIPIRNLKTGKIEINTLLKKN